MNDANPLIDGPERNELRQLEKEQLIGLLLELKATLDMVDIRLASWGAAHDPYEMKMELLHIVRDR